MPKPQKSHAEICQEAEKLDSHESRRAYVAEACGEDTELRRRVEEHLFAMEPPEGFMRRGAAAADPQQPGDMIGRYKLREKLGEGGCGVVYVAEQEEPMRRRVALKIIKLGMDTKQVVARFQAERQALALMDHPSIAKVLDAGATDTGRPYFVMELVRGIKITDYCDKNNLPTEERLKLFIQVCSAIDHAHQKGIVHRDIKPSNILVTLHDSVAVPKVIDFGIAKAISDQPLTDKTIYTAFDQFIGTPVYMSPEQAEMSGTSIDTRSDIYSLGVLLYELLTGRTPFDAATLLRAGLDQMRQIIREQEPQRPSARLSTLEAAVLTAVATHRHADPPRLLNLIRGDLDWIVMKSLEKDRTRRYGTASGLAMDVQRHLSSEPVVARPPTPLYRLQKLFLRRKAVIATIVVASLIAIAALIIGMRISQVPAKNDMANMTSVAGVVVDESGRPFPDAEVVATMFGGIGYRYASFTNTDQNGRFEISVERWGNERGQLTFEHASMLRSVIGDVYKLTEIERKNIRVVLRRGRHAKGIILSSGGLPIAGALVEAIPSDPHAQYKHEVTDLQGRFLFRGLPEGEISVRAHSLALKEKGKARVVLTESNAEVNLRLKPIILKNPPQIITMLGMKLANLTPELQAVYDLPAPVGVLILDPGENHQRLRIGTLEEGHYFWMVGNKRITSLREMVAGLLRISEIDPPTDGRWADEGHRGRVQVVYGYRGGHGTNTQYINLTDDDVAELKRLAVVLQEKSPVE